MPVLGPSSSPPQTRPTANSQQPEVALIIENPVSLSQTTSKTDQNLGLESPLIPTSCKIPCVTLDADVITDVMASQLAMSLLGHTLFLKSQVPFPVVQLARMPGGQSDTRASKKRADLLSSFDTLACHLQTTFTALSTAIARGKSKAQPKPETATDINSSAHPCQFDDPANTVTNEKEPRRLARAYLAIVLGPSASSAKARVIFAVDGLEVKLWGKREDVGFGVVQGSGANREAEKVEKFEDEEDSEESEEDRSYGKTESVASVDESDSECGSESESGSGSDLESGLDSSADSIMDGTPPPSRSPSPSSSSRSSLSLSRSPSPAPEPNTPQQPQPAHSKSESGSKSIPKPQPPPEAHQGQDLRIPTYASEQQALRTAERLLSRTLANACAEDDGKGMGMSMAAELAPTQTHILLRAPRRFEHPSWTPKQNWMGVMDGVLGGFLEDSGLRDEGAEERRNGKLKKKGRVEGIWIRCRGSTTDMDGGEEEEPEERMDGEGDEDAEMIWWSWDGKIVGFSDW